MVASERNGLFSAQSEQCSVQGDLTCDGLDLPLRCRRTRFDHRADCEAKRKV